MTRMVSPRWSFAPVLALALLLGGCGTTGTNLFVPAAEMRVNPRGQIADTGFEASDLVIACADIQRALGQLHDVIYRGRQVSIVVEPVSNDTRFALAMDTFDDALLGQLVYRATPNWRFLRETNAAEAEADYFLVGRLQHLRPEQPTNHTTLFYSFQLVDSRNSEIVLEGSAELKNFAVPAS